MSIFSRSIFTLRFPKKDLLVYLCNIKCIKGMIWNLGMSYNLSNAAIV